MSIDEVKEKISPILREYGVKKASVFGSVARGDDRPDSDVDILVDLSEVDMDIYEYMQLKEKLEEKLGKDVDLVSEGYINKFLEPYIRPELKTIYEK
ncbi:MAG: nucleotidyltransferase domain-containing protein [Patescibacteria group bacterium]